MMVGSSLYATPVSVLTLLVTAWICCSSSANTFSLLQTRHTYVRFEVSEPAAETWSWNGAIHVMKGKLANCRSQRLFCRLSCRSPASATPRDPYTLHKQTCTHGRSVGITVTAARDTKQSQAQHYKTASRASTSLRHLAARHQCTAVCNLSCSAILAQQHAAWSNMPGQNQPGDPPGQKFASASSTRRPLCAAPAMT